ncbi:hypothetical protein [uncultured Paludibaculum sp.]|uniref:hypothetical protein n=1 Tax=uncultured Paludibaculum sp. TaxID=1765020 RepID=UPI002AAB0354|nr:hypothetical protein [uncultured Paludibaculum sp.]
MAQISARARAALYGLLSARFNTLLSTVAPAYGAQPFTIDFLSAPKSVNFFWGALDPDDLEETTVYKLPLMTLYSSQSANRHAQKPATFAGVVRMGSDVVLSWRAGNANQDYEALGDALEEVMNTLADELAQRNWVVSMGMDRGPVRRGQQNWYQVLRFSFMFEVLA